MSPLLVMFYRDLRWLIMSDLQNPIPLYARLAERTPPTQSPVMYQQWEELLFLHWAVAPEVVAATLPPGLRVDTFEGQAWVGVVPFSMRRVRPRFLPPVYGLSNFPELNLRTYVVDASGRPGVWFYSLDTPKLLPNWIARTFFHLNYRRARMQIVEKSGCRAYRAELKLSEGWDAPQDYEWARTGAMFAAEPSSLEFYLVERYRLFAYNSRSKRLLTGCVQHDPYPLQHVDLKQYSKRLFTLKNLSQPEGAPVSALASSGVDVRIYPMSRV